ncbi:MAG: 2-oxoacid:acceptor oxidoreductase family protein [Nanoarchaeota archaeon]
MRDEIFIAGHGGQGIVLAGSLLANVALEYGLEVCGMVAYGAEMRGGTAHSSVIISDSEISSPVILNPDTMLIMNKDSLAKFENDVKKGGLIVLNISECDRKVLRTDVEVLEIEAGKIAEELGNKKVANLVMVGAYIEKKGVLDVKTAMKVVRTVLPRANDELIELNKKALQRGASCI